MTSYRQQNADSVMIIRLDDGLLIPPDERNMDYQEYQQWVTDGGVLEPPVEPNDERLARVYLAVQQRINSVARTHSFTDTEQALSFAIAEPAVAADNPMFAACEALRNDALVLQKWNILAWALVLKAQTDDVGLQPAAALALIPDIVWPST